MIVRYLLRQYLRLAQHRALAADASPRLAQERLHARMARALRGTRIAELQDARIWDDLDRYRHHVRATTYADHGALIRDAMQGAPRAGIFERGATTAFGHSSSAKSFVPFTRAHIESFRAFQMEAVAEVAIGQGQRQILSSPSLMVQGSLEVERTVGGVLTGYSSAVMVERTPWLLKRRLLPSPDDLRLPDAGARTAQIGRALVLQRPRVLTGMPEFVVGVLRALLAGDDADRVREALRGIEVYAWSGMPVGQYRAFLAEHLAPGCHFFDAVSSTEGPIGLQVGEEGVYRPALTRSLLLFVRPGESEKRFAWELVEGETYDVLLGSFAGLHGYRVGDRVRVVSARPLRFELLPRAIDVGAACALLGGDASDLCAYLDPTTRVLRILLEGARAPSVASLAELASRLGAAYATVRLVDPGRIARAAVALSVHGITKLPRLHSRPEVQALLERHA